MSGPAPPVLRARIAPLICPRFGLWPQGEPPMRLRVTITLLGGIVALWPPVVRAQQADMVVTAQFSCDSLPVGPARTDCYIGLSRINRQQSEIAAGAAQQKKHTARYHQLTGRHRKIKRP